jgi:NADH-quinone oxidoreductase subunit N
VTSGFVGKLLVFGAAIEAGYPWLVVIGVVTSAIAAFFYLRVLVVMYMQESDDVPAQTPERAGPRAWEGLGPAASGVVALSALATLVLGLFWSPLIGAAQHATIFFPGT